MERIPNLVQIILDRSVSALVNPSVHSFFKSLKSSYASSYFSHSILFIAYLRKISACFLGASSILSILRLILKVKQMFHHFSYNYVVLSKLTSFSCSFMIAKSTPTLLNFNPSATAGKTVPIASY